MHYQIQQSQLKQTIGQRNNALVLITALFVLVILQTLIIYHVVDENKMQFTPLPPIISSPFSISRDAVSSGYLADMSRYFAMLRLNYTPASFLEQSKLLLRYTDSHFYGEFKQQLQQEATQIKANDISLSFMPIDTNVDSKHLTVIIHGDLVRTVGKSPLPVKRVSYRITYVYRDGVLKVTSMLPIKAKAGEDNSHV